MIDLGQVANRKEEIALFNSLRAHSDVSPRDITCWFETNIEIEVGATLATFQKLPAVPDAY
jgi:hypothetical protein